MFQPTPTDRFPTETSESQVREQLMNDVKPNLTELNCGGGAVRGGEYDICIVPNP